MCKYCDSDAHSYSDMPHYHCDIQGKHRSETEAVIRHEPRTTMSGRGLSEANASR